MKINLIFVGMKTEDVIVAIEKLLISDRLEIIDKTTKSVRIKEEKKRMKKAANQLYADYRNDSNLTAFTDLDAEGFYEAR